MTNEQQTKWKKSDLEQRLEAEGWKLLRNVNTEETSHQRMSEVRAKYGLRNVHYTDAYDCNGERDNNGIAIYVRKNPVSPKDWKKSDVQKTLEKDGWRLLTNCYKIYSDTYVREQCLKMYPEICVKEAYDSDGHPLPEMRALYVRVKRKK